MNHGGQETYFNLTWVIVRLVSVAAGSWKIDGEFEGISIGVRLYFKLLHDSISRR